MIAFGPVPSRRLGRSLGINNIPPKICSYSCVYCQLGRLTRMAVNRRAFFSSEDICAAVHEKIETCRKRREPVDYLAFVPDGEPTLDVHLGRTLETLNATGIPTAVITNGSLIWREDVQSDLSASKWVSLKLDTVSPAVWQKVNRAHRALELSEILAGMLEFAQHYPGDLVTETMLVHGINDSERDIRLLADFLVELGPSMAYVSIPIRPPAESWVSAPDEHSIVGVFHLLKERVARVECLTGYEGNAFSFTGNIEEDILNITAVHPMRREAVEDFLIRAGGDWSDIRKLVEQGRIFETTYDGHKFYMRNLSHRTGPSSDL